MGGASKVFRGRGELEGSRGYIVLGARIGPQILRGYKCVPSIVREAERALPVYLKDISTQLHFFNRTKSHFSKLRKSIAVTIYIGR